MFQQKNSKLYYTKPNAQQQLVKNDGKPLETFEKNENEFGYQSFLIPPPPPPPVRSVPYNLTGNQQRTAQQKIYEFKQRKFHGYY